MPTLFDDTDQAALDGPLIAALGEGYCRRLLLNPPTPTFNTRMNPGKAEAAARYASQRDVTRFLAVLDEMGLTITRKETQG